MSSQKKNTPFPANLLVEDDLDLSSLGLSMTNYSGSSFRGISINRFGTMPYGIGLETRGRYILTSNMSQPASSSAAPAATQSRFVPVPEIFFFCEDSALIFQPLLFLFEKIKVVEL